MADNWYVGKNGNRSGPFSSSQVREMAARGELAPTDMLWKEGLANWIQASAVKGLFAAQPAPVPTAAPVVNPYAPPAVSEFKIDAGSSGLSARPIQYAEFMPRVGAALLDGLFAGLMGCIPAFGIGVVFAVMAGNDADARQAASAFSSCCAQVIYQVIALAYYVTLETSSKQGTWGKQIVGIKVTDLQGNRITIGRAIGRYFAKIITGFTCGIGLLMPLFTEKKQTLHDMIAGCLALNK